MKIYISADMEGVSGVVHREHTNPTGYDYEMARRLMTDEVNAAVEACLAGGATDVWVADAHGGNTYRSILIDRIHPDAQLITGGERPLGQLTGLDGSFAMLVLLGYHTRHSTMGVLDHTTNGQAVFRLWINDVEVGEIGLNAAIAGACGVPVGVVTGDDRTVAEAQALLPWVHGATVKWAIGRYAARCLSPRHAQQRIRDAIDQAVRRRDTLRPYLAAPPITARVQWKDSGSAQRAGRVPGVRVVTDDTVEFTASSMDAVFEAYQTMIGLYTPAWGAWIRGGS